jgi:mannose-6-phosphate isomerase-like protein (cupin superfamily)
MVTDFFTAPTAHLRVSDALARLPGADNERFVGMFRHGTLLVELYAPRGHDLQQPHARDEIYVIASGHGTFFDGTTRRLFGPGDLLFVAAGIPHRFEDFSADFAVWVMFYGPEGGEEQR